jgi:hypothetical protein
MCLRDCVAVLYGVVAQRTIRRPNQRNEFVASAGAKFGAQPSREGNCDESHRQTSTRKKPRNIVIARKTRASF